MGDFRKLIAWQEAMRLVSVSLPGIERLPSSERFALGDQWRRALYSVPLNIAEGASRRGPREFRRYLDVALGSLHEIEAILAIVAQQKYLPGEELDPIRSCRDTCARMVYGLLRGVATASRRERAS
jgi:four helix bundle protein